jgi:uncharacterized membrane protein
MPTRRKLLRRLDAPRIEQAIARAEQRTSAEIRVSIAPFFAGDVQRTADRAFARLGMVNTRERNGVLIFLVPSRRTFAVIGDQGVHARVGQAFWDELREILTVAFADARFTEGLVTAIDRIGDRLAEHFPALADDNPNELPDTIDLGLPAMRG